MMTPCRFRFYGPACAGATRIELTVGVVLVVLLAAIAIGPVRDHLATTRIRNTVEKAHVLSTLLSQYSTDNNGFYPTGEGTNAAGKSEGIALDLLQNKYAPDAAIFAVNAAHKYVGSNPDFLDFTAADIDWDFTAGATATTGLAASVSDLTPLLYCTGETVTYPTAGKGLDLELSGKGPFENKGIVVAYKANNAVFIAGTSSGTTMVCKGFISTALKDSGTYTQIKP